MTEQTRDTEQTEDRPLTEEELFLEDVIRLQQEALAEERARREAGIPLKKRQPRTVRLAVYAIVFTMIFSTFAVLFQMYSIPAIDFIRTSSALSQQDDIRAYKEAVVTINTHNSKGTGFAVTPDGYIVTNEHVIDDALTITVTFPSAGIFKGEVVASYEDIDLAVLKVDGQALPTLQLAYAPTYTENEKVRFIGNPLAFSGIANEGTLLQSVQTSLQSPVVMLDAPVYKGNSGSPVINADGVVIGVIYATLKDDEHGKVGLFVPIDALHARFDFP